MFQVGPKGKNHSLVNMEVNFRSVFMAGFLYFSNKNGVSLGTSSIDIIAEYLRPYISQVGKDVMQGVYETYDLYDQTLDFSKLSKIDYMQCYENIEKAIEVDLKSNPMINGRSQEWIFRAWFEEIKPKMQISPIYDSYLLGVNEEM